MSAPLPETTRIDLRPLPGPQEAFLATPADVAFFGGGAGPGKSWSLVYDPARFARNPGFRGVIFRRTVPEIIGGGGLWEQASELYPHFGGVSREGQWLDWRFPSGARIQFSHLVDEKAKLKHQGRAYATIGFDEITHFTEGQFWYLQSRARTKCGVRPYTRATCNPIHKGFVRKLVDWWIGPDGYPIKARSGVLRWYIRDGDTLHWGSSAAALRRRFPKKKPRSFTFIPATIKDNPILRAADPDYEAVLESLPRLERERLLGGNWNVAPSAGMYFRCDQFRYEDDEPPASDFVAIVRAWDKAGTEPHEGNKDPDWTSGPKIALHRNGSVWILDHKRDRKGPAGVHELQLATAKADGNSVSIALYEDPGQAGKVDTAATARLLHGYHLLEPMPTNRGVNKETFWRPWSAQVQSRNVHCLRRPWTAQLTGEHEEAPTGSHDDGIDSCALGYVRVIEQGESSLENLTKM